MAGARSTSGRLARHELGFGERPPSREANPWANQPVLAEDIPHLNSGTLMGFGGLFGEPAYAQTPTPHPVGPSLLVSSVAAEAV